MSIKTRILVTSAAGHTGAAAVHDLLAKGFPVRAFVRRRDARAEALEQAGAEIFVGDLYDMNDLRQALVDVKRAFYVPPFAPNLLHGTMLFAIAAEEAGLESLALLSGWNPHSQHPGVLTREHWIANNIVRWMPTVDVTYINPGIFAFIYFLGLPAVQHLGMLALPFGQGLNAPPSNEDIGAVAAAVLADPTPSAGSKLGALGGLVKMLLTRRPDFDRWEAERGHPMLSQPLFATDNPEWMASAGRQQIALLNSSSTRVGDQPSIAV